LKNPKDITSDSHYKELGSLGLVAVLLQWNFNLLADRM